MSRLFISSGPARYALAMAPHEPRFFKRGHGGRWQSEEPQWRRLPVEGSAHWRRITGADRRARRVKLLLILCAALVGVALAFVKGS